MIDLLLGRLEPDQAELLRKRIQDEPDLRRLHDDLAHTLAAVDLLIEPEPPEDLVEKTLARIRHDQQMKTILARQEVGRRIFRPTFNLRELAAMAAVAVMMAAVFVPSIRQGKNIALVADCSARIGQIGSAVVTFSNANNGRLPVADVQRRRWLTAQDAEKSAAASNSMALFRLVQHGYAQPPIFQCPAVGGGSFVVKSGMADFPAARYVSYSYQHTVGSLPVCLSDSCMTGRESKMAVLADATPVFEGGKFHSDRANDSAASPNHKETGQNVLYLDGHVAWTAKPTVGVGENNIYLVDNITYYKGDEAPASPLDTFLLPAYSGQ
jgi:prepilin-type processing-associated H-X9-DG protein